MAGINLASTMDKIAEVAQPLITRRYPYPAGNISPPALVVGYPTEIDFDATFNRGSDRLVFPLYFIVGDVNEQGARDLLSQYISDADNIKSVFDGDLDGTVNSSSVGNCEIVYYTVGAIQYLAARFDLEIFS